MHSVTTNTANLTGTTNTSFVKTGGDLFNITTTLHTVWSGLTSWRECFESYDELESELSMVLNNITSPRYADKPQKLTSKAFSNLKQCCDKVANYGKDHFQFNLKNEVIEAVGGGMKAIDKEKLEELLSKLTTSMVKQLEQMLYGELVKTIAQTMAMIGALVETHSLIRNSKQYRESPTVQQATTRINGNLDKARNFYQAADGEINRIETTPNACPTQYALGQISLNLDRAKFENDCAARELQAILRDITQHLQLLSSNRTRHGINIGLSLLSMSVTAVQFTSAPSFILSATAKALFAINGGLHAVNTIGHSIGFYWSHEEIHKLEELQHNTQNLEATMKDLFETINYGITKLENIRQRIDPVLDPTLIAQRVIQ